MPPDQEDVTMRNAEKKQSQSYTTVAAAPIEHSVLYTVRGALSPLCYPR